MRGKHMIVAKPAASQQRSHARIISRPPPAIQRRATSETHQRIAQAAGKTTGNRPIVHLSQRFILHFDGRLKAAPFQNQPVNQCRGQREASTFQSSSS